MSRESELTQLWLKWVESELWLKWVEPELSRPWKSTIWVESESTHTDRHLSQSWVNWILLESKLSHWFFWRENVKILHSFVASQGKEPTFSYIWPPPPGQQLLAKLGKMWWVVSQIWLNSDSNELSRNSELNHVSKFGIWVDSELSQVDCHMSQSWVSPKNLSRAQPWLPLDLGAPQVGIFQE